MKTIKVELTIEEVTIIQNALTSHAQKAARFAHRHNTGGPIHAGMLRKSEAASMLAAKVHVATKS